MKENRKYLAAVNLSALTSMIFLPMGILLPLIMLYNQKDNIAGLQRSVKKVINFQITWLIIFIPIAGFSIAKVLLYLNSHGFDVTFDSDAEPLKVFLLQSGLFLIPLLLIYNIAMTIINAVRANNGKEERYFRSIPFFKYY